VPFCAARCDYCEFYSVALGRAAEAGAAADGAAADSAAEAGAESLVATSSGAADARERLFERFVAALRAEWERERERFAVRGLETVYVGGGSPSLLGQERRGGARGARSSRS
jgi:coproporphyrinogen III oxidase-like Fe-S oxidoreductase